VIATGMLAFASGAAIEATAIWWVHHSERRAWIKASLCSMLYGIAQVTGIGESIRNWHVAPWFVLGYGVGTAIAVKLKGAT
jgi:hypothetical protein